MSTIAPTDFATARELIAFLLEDDQFQPRSIFDATDRGVNGLIFRGQASLTHKLLPSAHRTPNRLADYTPQPPAGPQNDWESLDGTRRSTLLMFALHAELRAIHLFLEQADRLGLNTPLNYEQLHAHQPALDALNRVEDNAWQIPFPEEAYLPAIAMAQHYGVPTRLLDWTESALVAAFFAAYEASSALNGYMAKPEERIGIYILNTRSYMHDNLKGKIHLVDAPRHRNPTRC